MKFTASSLICYACPKVAALFDEIALQGLDVSLESLSTLVGDAADGARTLPLEGLLYLDIARRR